MTSALSNAEGNFADLRSFVACPADMTECDPATAPCTINICGATTGLCSAALLDDASVCVPEDTTCSATGTCDEGACVADAQCECVSDTDCAPPESSRLRRRTDRHC